MIPTATAGTCTDIAESESQVRRTLALATGYTGLRRGLWRNYSIGDCEQGCVSLQLRLVFI